MSYGNSYQSLLSVASSVLHIEPSVLVVLQRFPHVKWGRGRLHRWRDRVVWVLQQPLAPPELQRRGLAPANEREIGRSCRLHHFLGLQSREHLPPRHHRRRHPGRQQQVLSHVPTSFLRTATCLFADNLSSYYWSFQSSPTWRRRKRRTR